MKLLLNKIENQIETLDELSEWFESIDSTENVEAWIVSTEETSLCMLKNVKDVFLMYLRYPGDVGFVSGSQDVESEMTEFLLANGQTDEYPLSWCIDKEMAYKAMVYFFVNAGDQSPHIAWHAA